MKTSFVLHIVGLVVHGERFDSLTIQWEEDLAEEEILHYYNRWGEANQNPAPFVRNLNGLQGLGGAALFMDVYPGHVLAGSQESSRSRIKPEFFQ